MDPAILWTVVGAVGVALLVIGTAELFICLVRRILGKWWRSGLFQPPSVIEFREIDGSLNSGKPTGVHGFHLAVSTSSGTRLITHGQALDDVLFWKTWAHLGGQRSGWYDSDGDPFDPLKGIID